jgi:hypothetical protein
MAVASLMKWFTLMLREFPDFGWWLSSTEWFATTVFKAQA